MPLDTLGEFTGRDGPPSSEQPATPPAAAPNSQAPLPPPPAPNVVVSTPAQTAMPSSSSEDFMTAASKAFSREIAEHPPTETPPVPAQPTKPVAPEAAPAQAETHPGETLPDAPVHWKEPSKKAWRELKGRAQEQLAQKEGQLKQLREELAASKAQVKPELNAELDAARTSVQSLQSLVERIAIERSQIFKDKILEPEEAVKNRLAKVAEGTTLSSSDLAALLSGDLARREEVIEGHSISAYRKAQIIEALSSWDKTEAERERMLARGKQSFEEYTRDLQTQAESQRAQIVRESAKIFDDQLVTICPKLEPYNTIPGNDEWNRNVEVLKQNARKIYMGEVDRATLAQVALLAPAAYVYQKLFQASQKQIQELKAQVDTMRGVSPSVRDRGADQPTSVPPLSSSNGDFVKGLVDRFRKETGF
jgi:hypothetical protein